MSKHDRIITLTDEKMIGGRARAVRIALKDTCHSCKMGFVLFDEIFIRRGHVRRNGSNVKRWHISCAKRANLI